MLATVKGGTGAGRTMHRKHAPTTNWTCSAGHGNKAYAATCLHPGCREKRP